MNDACLLGRTPRHSGGALACVGSVVGWHPSSRNRRRGLGRGAGGAGKQFATGCNSRRRLASSQAAASQRSVWRVRAWRRRVPGGPPRNSKCSGSSVRRWMSSCRAAAARRTMLAATVRADNQRPGGISGCSAACSRRSRTSRCFELSVMPAARAAGRARAPGARPPLDRTGQPGGSRRAGSS